MTVRDSRECTLFVPANLSHPKNLSIREIAAEEGISEATVYKWRNEVKGAR